jgi:hypothetical protein
MYTYIRSTRRTGAHYNINSGGEPTTAAASEQMVFDGKSILRNWR